MVSRMDDLVRWLGEQLDADAARAEEAAAVRGGHWSAQSLQSGRREPRHYVGASVEAGVACSDSEVLSGGGATVRHAAAHDPARVLRETDAKRLMVERYEEVRPYGGDVAEEFRTYLLLLLAAPYADQPGFREEWRL